MCLKREAFCSECRVMGLKHETFLLVVPSFLCQVRRFFLGVPIHSCHARAFLCDTPSTSASWTRLFSSAHRAFCRMRQAFCPVCRASPMRARHFLLGTPSFLLRALSLSGHASGYGVDDHRLSACDGANHASLGVAVFCEWWDVSRIACTVPALDSGRVRIRPLVEASDTCQRGPETYRLQAFDNLCKCAMVNTDDVKHLFGLFIHWLLP